jgi:hypothetical protein
VLCIVGVLVGAVGIEIASLLYKDLHGNDLAPPPFFNCWQTLLILRVPKEGLGRLSKASTSSYWDPSEQRKVTVKFSSLSNEEEGE